MDSRHSRVAMEYVPELFVRRCHPFSWNNNRTSSRCYSDDPFFPIRRYLRHWYLPFESQFTTFEFQKVQNYISFHLCKLVIIWISFLGIFIVAQILIHSIRQLHAILWHGWPNPTSIWTFRILPPRNCGNKSSQRPFFYPILPISLGLFAFMYSIYEVVWTIKLMFLRSLTIAITK